MRPVAPEGIARWKAGAALLTLVGALVVLSGSSVAALTVRQPADPDEGAVELVVFHGEGCPHCARELAFLDGLQERWPDLHIERYEVWHDEANQGLFRSYATAHGIDAGGVPTTFLAGRTWVGFSEATGDTIEAAVAALHEGVDPPPEPQATIDLPGIGSVEVGDRSLLVATLLIGFADGMNPCSLWALSILLALVLHSGSRTWSRSSDRSSSSSPRRCMALTWSGPTRPWTMRRR